MTAEKEPRTFTGAVGVADRRLALVSDDPRRIEAFRREHPGVREIDGKGKVLMPGLINTHCHVAMTLQRGYADDIALMEWLNDYIWPFEARQTADDVALGKVSPALRAGDIKVPVMLVHGKDDKTADFNQFKVMEAALKAAGNPAQVMLADGEGHGFVKPESITELYKRMDAFLAKNIGPGVQ